MNNEVFNLIYNPKGSKAQGDIIYIIFKDTDGKFRYRKIKKSELDSYDFEKERRTKTSTPQITQDVTSRLKPVTDTSPTGGNQIPPVPARIIDTDLYEITEISPEDLNDILKTKKPQSAFFD